MACTARSISATVVNRSVAMSRASWMQHCRASPRVMRLRLFAARCMAARCASRQFPHIIAAKAESADDGLCDMHRCIVAYAVRTGALKRTSVVVAI